MKCRGLGFLKNGDEFVGVRRGAVLVTTQSSQRNIIIIWCVGCRVMPTKVRFDILPRLQI